jgi:hypothetical protein
MKRKKKAGVKVSPYRIAQAVLHSSESRSCYLVQFEIQGRGSL